MCQVMTGTSLAKVQMTIDRDEAFLGESDRTLVGCTLKRFRVSAALYREAIYCVFSCATLYETK